jgi:uncharacterized damage-inducible protein DinB
MTRFMNVIRDLYAHQAWADAEHWKAIEASPAALADDAIGRRLFHIHQVQRFFRWAVGSRDRTPALAKPEEFPDAAQLKAWGRAYHDEMASFLADLTDTRLRERVDIPWFKDPPLELAVEDALLQAIMHSHYHRGQNATRLRELGGEPPLTDLIIWHWRGRPAPRWD